MRRQLWASRVFVVAFAMLIAIAAPAFHFANGSAGTSHPTAMAKAVDVDLPDLAEADRSCGLYLPRDPFAKHPAAASLRLADANEQAIGTAFKTAIFTERRGASALHPTLVSQEVKLQI